LRSLFLITRSALRLSRRDRLEAVRAWLWLMAARAGLTLFSYKWIARLVARIPVRRISARTTPERCALAIGRAARVAPGCGCLPQAVAAQCLLRRDRLNSNIVFGVAHEPVGLTGLARQPLRASWAFSAERGVGPKNVPIKIFRRPRAANVPSRRRAWP